jgi:SAM-dependent methyltransferase
MIDSQPVSPYLEGDVRRGFDAWLESAVARLAAGLTTAEVRKGVRAVSSLYLERRAGGDFADARSGRGKRAALATYYAPLHFLVSYHAAREHLLPLLAGAREIADLGCGTGPCGAALARAAGGGPLRVLGIDRSGWMLSEARHTAAAFGLILRTRRASLPEALPRLGPGSLAVLGWFANELAAEARAALLAGLVRAAERGARAVVIEPLAGGVSPWWRAAAVELARAGFEDRLFETELELPDWIRRLDEASGLDHTKLGARLLFGPATA